MDYSKSLLEDYIVYIIIPAFFEEKKGIMCYRSLSVRPSDSSLPASPPTLLMLESPNLCACRLWQRI